MEGKAAGFLTDSPYSSWARRWLQLPGKRKQVVSLSRFVRRCPFRPNCSPTKQAVRQEALAARLRHLAAIRVEVHVAGGLLVAQRAHGRVHHVHEVGVGGLEAVRRRREEQRLRGVQACGPRETHSENDKKSTRADTGLAGQQSGGRTASTPVARCPLAGPRLPAAACRVGGVGRAPTALTPASPRNTGTWTGLG